MKIEFPVLSWLMGNGVGDMIKNQSKLDAKMLKLSKPEEFHGQRSLEGYIYGVTKSQT